LRSRVGRHRRFVSTYNRHAGETPTITVGQIEDGFYVADDGPGIPEEQREEIFELGYTTNDTGTGYGLNIVKEIADEHAWKIVVTESETGGARFELMGAELIPE
jgi:signal transduction histidine kinase